MYVNFEKWMEKRWKNRIERISMYNDNDVFHVTLHRILKPDECDNETNDNVDDLDDNACLF